MADFYAVLQRTISALPENTGEARRAVYDRARQALIRQLQTLDPPLSPSEITRQRLDLEESIRKVEAEFAALMFSTPPFQENDDQQEPKAEAGNGEASAAPVAPVKPAEQKPEAATDKASSVKEPSSEAATPAPDEKDRQPKAEAQTKADAKNLKPKPTPKLEGAERPTGEKPKRRNTNLVAALMLLLVAGVAVLALYSQREALFGGSDSQDSAIVANAPESNEPGVATQPKNDDRVDDSVPSSQADNSSGQSTLERQEGTTAPRVILPQGTTPVPSASDSASGETAGQEPDTDTSSADQQDEATSSTGADDEEAIDAATGDSRAFLYEAGADPAAEGRASVGSIRWALVNEDNVDNVTQSPTIRAEISFPDRGMTASLSIRKNADPGLPASYLFEFVFEVSRGFEGEGIAGVPGILLKNQEQEPGQPLTGAPAKIAENFYWFALTNGSAENDVNVQLLQNENWFDILLFYDSGLRAVMSVSKGSEGSRVFSDAFASWESQ